MERDTESSEEIPQEKLGDKKVTVVSNGMVRWNALSKCPNEAAVEPWMAVVIDYDTSYEYNWDIEFQDRDRIQGDAYLSVEGVHEGDIIRVSGGGHQKSHKQCYYVQELGRDKIVVREVDDIHAIEAVKRRNRGEKQEYINAIEERLQKMDTEELRDVAEDIGAV
jgi:hypothetical protein